MDPVQFADGRCLIRAHTVCFHGKLFEVQLKICTYREIHMHFQYIKCWLDRGLINEIRLIKSPDIVL